MHEISWEFSEIFEFLHTTSSSFSILSSQKQVNLQLVCSARLISIDLRLEIFSLKLLAIILLDIRLMPRRSIKKSFFRHFSSYHAPKPHLFSIFLLEILQSFWASTLVTTGKVCISLHFLFNFYAGFGRKTRFWELAKHSEILIIYALHCLWKQKVLCNSQKSKNYDFSTYDRQNIGL